MDAEHRIIEVVEDDMGEGFADEVPPELLEKEQTELLEKEQQETDAAREQEHARKLEEFQNRQEKRPEKEPAQGQAIASGMPAAESNPFDIPVKWVTSIPKDATVLLMVGVEQNRSIIFQTAYRVAGTRENGKVILKPALKKKGCFFVASRT